jgi:hypothetical protein
LLFEPSFISEQDAHTGVLFVIRMGRYMGETARQKVVIARLCMALKITEPVEEKAMSRGEAGRHIRFMAREVKARREGG